MSLDYERKTAPNCPGFESNLRLSCCEVTVLTTTLFHLYSNRTRQKCRDTTRLVSVRGER